eukprot:gene12189-biopygen394
MWAGDETCRGLWRVLGPARAVAGPSRRTRASRGTLATPCPIPGTQSPVEYARPVPHPQWKMRDWYPLPSGICETGIQFPAEYA